MPSEFIQVLQAGDGSGVVAGENDAYDSDRRCGGEKCERTAMNLFTGLINGMLQGARPSAVRVGERSPSTGHLTRMEG